jgi:catalase
VESARYQADGFTAHAHGHITTGTFTPTSEAGELSKAPHFNGEVPVIVRFSSSTGIPNIPDTDPNANPRGIGIRFVLGNNGHKHTDIVAHSANAFPGRTGQDFLDLLSAIGGGKAGEYLESHPAAAHFVQLPKPFPVSFATEKFYGLNAFKFVSKDGKGTYVRYYIEPVAGFHVLEDSEVASKSPTYLFDELNERLGKEPIEFKLLAQIAEDGDPTDDITKHWPDERKKVDLGTIKIDKSQSEEESHKEQKKIIYDPIPRVDGVEPSDDPILDMRAAVYLIGGKERRAAPDEQVSTASVS